MLKRHTKQIILCFNVLLPTFIHVNFLIRATQFPALEKQEENNFFFRCDLLHTLLVCFFNNFYVIFLLVRCFKDFLARALQIYNNTECAIIPSCACNVSRNLFI